MCTFNTNEFENNDNNVYSNELKLKKDEDLCKALFLDLSIEVQDRVLNTELFDKRDAFPFYINCMPNLDSNMPSKIFYTFFFYIKHLHVKHKKCSHQVYI